PQVGQLVLLNVVDRVRPRSHDAHVPFEHIEELGPFVNAVTTKHAPHSGDSGIVGDLERGAVSLVHVTQIVFLLVGVSDHGAKLEAADLAPFAAHTPRRVDHGTARIQFRGDSCCQHERRANYQRHNCQTDIQDPLDKELEYGRGLAAQFQNGHVADVGYAGTQG